MGVEKMDHRTVEDVIIEFLAEHQHGTTPAELRRQIQERGEDMPIDSQLAVEVVVRVQNHFGVRLPTTAETAHYLRSISGFAARVQALVEEAEGSAAGGREGA